MKIIYSDSKEISKNQLESLFRSLDWKSAYFPNELHKAMKNSHSVVTAWSEGVWSKLRTIRNKPAKVEPGNLIYATDHYCVPSSD